MQRERGSTQLKGNPEIGKQDELADKMAQRLEFIAKKFVKPDRKETLGQYFMGHTVRKIVLDYTLRDGEYSISVWTEQKLEYISGWPSLYIDSTPVTTSDKFAGVKKGEETVFFRHVEHNGLPMDDPSNRDRKRNHPVLFVPGQWEIRMQEWEKAETPLRPLKKSA